ncbi:MAG: amidohydrolase [Balneolaceae bacterium]|nr:amidohydrolase [Balneolaceae bacterium]
MEAANRIDGQGRVLLPGLIDAHVHVSNLGSQELGANVTGSQTLDEALQIVSDYAGQYPDAEWIRGRGWNQVFWEIGRFPTAEELDQAVSDRPVWLGRVDGHAGWANSRAMEIAGITAETEAPEGGQIIRDEEGNPTGVFVDGAMSLITSQIPAPSKQERDQALSLALQQMRSHGLTSVHDAGIGLDSWERYKRFVDGDSLTTRIYAMYRGTGDTFEQLAADGPVNSYADDMLALRSVKLSIDGALGSRGAALLEPYSDDPGNRGLLFHSQEEVNGMVMKVASAGWQMNVHAIGDRANRVILNAFEAARDSLGEQGLRHRVEHAQIVHPDDIPRFEELNIVASMQPTHATSDMNMAEDRIGADRMEGAYAWQTFLDQGTVIAAGSDFPVEHVNPFYGLYSAVTRMDHQGNPEGGWYPSEAMSRLQAFRAFTLDAAWAAHQEEVLGTLEEGKWADFILVDRDYFEVPASEIWQTEVLQTWVAGEKVYDTTQ